jgi:tetratricopeptide (TPR) repeat protein
MQNQLPNLINTGQADLRHRINTLLDAENVEAALALAKQLQAQAPKDGEANFLLARSLVFNRQYREAIPIAQYAYNLMPQNPAAAYLIGRLYLDHQLYEYAAPLLRNALQVMPQSGVIHWAMADFHVTMLNGVEAKLHYEKAISLLIGDPNYDDVRFDYANCLEFIGNATAADKIYEALESSGHQDKDALQRRALLKLHKVNSDVGDRVRSRIDDPSTSDTMRANLLLSLGNMHEKEKDYDTAFAIWARARKLQNRGHLSIGNQLTKTLKRLYTPAIFKSLQNLGHPSETPLFIVGMPRSGTTLAEQILAAHSEIAGSGELGRMAIAGRQFLDRYTGPKDHGTLVSNAKDGYLKRWAEEYLAMLKAIIMKPHKFVVDKTPTQFADLGYIHMCFPNAKFIHCQRHPADSFISSYQNALSQFHSYAYSQDGYAEAYLAKEAIMAHWRTIFPKQIFELRYEDLVEDPQGVVSRLLKFLGLEFEEQCLRFFETDRAVRTISKSQVRQAVYTTSRERWRNYEKHLGPLFEAFRKSGFDYAQH